MHAPCVECRTGAFDLPASSSLHWDLPPLVCTLLTDFPPFGSGTDIVIIHYHAIWFSCQQVGDRVCDFGGAGTGNRGEELQRVAQVRIYPRGMGFDHSSHLLTAGIDEYPSMTAWYKCMADPTLGEISIPLWQPCIIRCWPRVRAVR